MKPEEAIDSITKVIRLSQKERVFVMQTLRMVAKAAYQRGYNSSERAARLPAGSRDGVDV